MPTVARCTSERRRICVGGSALISPTADGGRSIPPSLASLTSNGGRRARNSKRFWREAALITELQPVANVQIGAPALQTRAIPAALVRDVVVLVPSLDPDSVDVVAARAQGDVKLERADRSGTTLAETSATLWEFFRQTAEAPRVATRLALAPLVFSWIAGRGRHATRVDPHDASNAGELTARLASLFSDASLFVERLVTLR